MRVFFAWAMMVVAMLAHAQAGHAQAAASAALHDMAGAESKPLVLLRFNQRSIHYEQQLFMAISRAVEVKPAVMFDVVSMVPQTHEPQRNAEWLATARYHTQEVVQSMHRMGVPPSRIRISERPERALSHDEVHLFVR